MIRMIRILFFFIFILLILLPVASKPSAEELTVIKSQDLPIYQQALEGFKKVYKGRLREFDLKGDPQEAEKIIKELNKHPTDLIIAIGLLASRVAKEDIKQTPIIFCMVFDPERFSLSNSKEKITGVTLEIPLHDLFSRIRDLFPEIKKIGVLYDPKKSRRMISQAKDAAGPLGFSLLAAEVHSEKGLPAAFRGLLGKIDLLWMIPDSTVVTPESLDFILLTSFENNLPIITFSDDLVKRGAVAAFSPDYQAIGEEAGHLALRVLGGEDPSRIPIRQAPKIRLSVNLKTTKKMGIQFNSKVIQSADRVYE